MMYAAYIQGFDPLTPTVEPLPDGKCWAMHEDFSYTDEYGIISTARASFEEPFIFDFASIPKFAWPIVGSPATGRHRYAAIIHDANCIDRIDSWQVVHKRFLSAMKWSKVSKWRRWMIFLAVWFFGPRWEDY